MASVYAKTEAGHAEIKSRERALARHARTLLVLTDGTRSAEQLMEMVQGATPADFAALVDGGLVTEVSSAKALAISAPAAPNASDAAPPTGPAGTEAEHELTYAELYDSLNALSKEQLGLFKGYKFALEIEKADGIEGLRGVAVRLVDEVQKVKGDAAAQMVRRALGLKR